MKNEKMTAKERMDAEARLAAINAEARSIRKSLKEDDARTSSTDVEKVVVDETPVEAPAEEATTEEAPVEATAEEATTEEATVEATDEEATTEETTAEAPVEEATTEEATAEAPAEEATTEEATVEASAEEATTEEATAEAPAEEVTTEEATVEAPAEEVTVEEAPVEAPAEEATEEEAPVEASAKPVKENKKSLKDIVIGFLACGFIVCLVGIIALFAMYNPTNTTPPVGDDPNAGVVDPGTTVEPEFDMDAFVVSAVNIAKTLTTDEDVATNVDIFAEKIGADKLEELVGKYGELTVQKAIAEYIAFVPEIKMNQYINNNGLAYNPNAADDYYQMIDDADKAYMEATGKNPSGALMSLEGYDTYKSNREAMKALIAESGDAALLTWYEVKTTGYDAMVQQNGDTEKAVAYKEEVKLELVNNVNGSVKLLELQLEQNVNGTNPDTLAYTDVYKEFILNNYMYVVAN